MNPNTPSPLGCDRESAIAFLGCSPAKFEELTNRKIVKRLSSGWYSYDMLRQAFQKIEEAAAIDPKVIDLQKKLKENEKRQAIRSKGDLPTDREEKELLFPDLTGRRGS